jgi:hypothetical protein
MFPFEVKMGDGRTIRQVDYCPNTGGLGSCFLDSHGRPNLVPVNMNEKTIIGFDPIRIPTEGGMEAFDSFLAEHITRLAREAPLINGVYFAEGPYANPFGPEVPLPRDSVSVHLSLCSFNYTENDPASLG